MEVFNTNTLKITSGVANKEDIILSFKKAILDVEKQLCRKFECPFKINIINILDKVTNRQKKIGSGYIWIGNPELYWMLIGHNPDGSPRIEEYPDPNWIPKTKEETTMNDDDLWADLIESEISDQAPIIRKILPPLITLPGFKHSDGQKLELKERATEFNLDPNNIPDIGYFKIERAFVESIPEGKIGNILCSYKIPDWIPNDVLKSIFSLYISDPTVELSASFGNNRNTPIKKEKAPYILRLRDTVFIIYDPESRDASFARMMQRKTRIHHPDDPNKKCEIIFDYAYDNFKNKIIVQRKSLKVVKLNNILIGKKCLFNGYDYIICVIKDDIVQIKNEFTCEVKLVTLKDIQIF